MYEQYQHKGTAPQLLPMQNHTQAIFAHILQMGFLNSFRLFNIYTIGRKVTLLDCRMDIIQDLLTPVNKYKRLGERHSNSKLAKVKKYQWSNSLKTVFCMNLQGLNLSMWSL